MIRVAPGFAEADRSVAAALYWEAFRRKLGGLLGPDARGTALMADLMDPNFAISAVQDDRLVGLAGFKTADGALTEGGGLDVLKRHFGTLGALWRVPCLAILDRPVEPGVLTMDGICIAAEARSTGLGTRLLRAVKEAARARGLTCVRLDVIDENPRARALYEREGFVACGEVQTGPLRYFLKFRTATRMDAQV